IVQTYLYRNDGIQARTAVAGQAWGHVSLSALELVWARGPSCFKPPAGALKLAGNGAEVHTGPVKQPLPLSSCPASCLARNMQILRDLRLYIVDTCSRTISIVCQADA